MTRHESRELAFILIFEKSFQSDVTVVELIESALELELFPENAFAENLVRWSAKRISRASRAIMRLAVCELLFSEDLPIGVIINEAVEIAKKYATKEDASYINGVLATVAKKLGR